MRKSYSNIPAFPVLKKNGTIRLVVDYRELNSKTHPVQYPIPMINDFLTQLNNSKIFSQIDLNSGCYQIPLKEEDKHKTAFVLNNDNMILLGCRLDCQTHQGHFKPL